MRAQPPGPGPEQGSRARGEEQPGTQPALAQRSRRLRRQCLRPRSPRRPPAADSRSRRPSRSAAKPSRTSRPHRCSTAPPAGIARDQCRERWPSPPATTAGSRPALRTAAAVACRLRTPAGRAAGPPAPARRWRWSRRSPRSRCPPSGAGRAPDLQQPVDQHLVTRGAQQPRRLLRLVARAGHQHQHGAQPCGEVARRQPRPQLAAGLGAQEPRSSAAAPASSIRSTPAPSGLATRPRSRSGRTAQLGQCRDRRAAGPVEARRGTRARR